MLLVGINLQCNSSLARLCSCWLGERKKKGDCPPAKSYEGISIFLWRFRRKSDRDRQSTVTIFILFNHPCFIGPISGIFLFTLDSSPTVARYDEHRSC